jgi:hypothetical protein
MISIGVAMIPSPPSSTASPDLSCFQSTAAAPFTTKSTKDTKNTKTTKKGGKIENWNFGGLRVAFVDGP